MLVTLNNAAGARNKVVLFVVIAIHIASVAAWNWTVKSFEVLRLGGKSRMILRRALVSTMIQLTNRESESYPSGECLSVMSEAVETATSECWVGFVQLWGSCIQLMFIICLSTYTTLKTSSKYMVVLPFVMMAFDFVVLLKRMGEQAE